jgi:hypothetical protein
MGVDLVGSRLPRTFWFYMVLVDSADHPNFMEDPPRKYTIFQQQNHPPRVRHFKLQSGFHISCLDISFTCGE